jgi:hypothetical protein
MRQNSFVGLKLGNIHKCLGYLFNDLKLDSLLPMTEAALYTMLTYFRMASETIDSIAQQDPVPDLPKLHKPHRTCHNSGKRKCDFMDHNLCKNLHSNTTDKKC